LPFARSSPTLFPLLRIPSLPRVPPQARRLRFQRARPPAHPLPALRRPSPRPGGELSSSFLLQLPEKQRDRRSALSRDFPHDAAGRLARRRPAHAQGCHSPSKHPFIHSLQPAPPLQKPTSLSSSTSTPRASFRARVNTAPSRPRAARPAARRAENHAEAQRPSRPARGGAPRGARRCARGGGISPQRGPGAPRAPPPPPPRPRGRLQGGSPLSARARLRRAKRRRMSSAVRSVRTQVCAGARVRANDAREARVARRLRCVASQSTFAAVCRM
jgi:hypothetical protein